MNFLKKVAFCYIAPLLSICSMTTTSLEAQCCDPAPCVDWCSLLVPALVGAAAGAATAAAIKNRGKHGKKGEPGDPGPQGPAGARGPAGENPFLADAGESLKFKYEIANLVIGSDSSSDFTITPFVCSPDGVITAGKDFRFESSSSSSSSFSDDFKISNPVFGTYTFGFNISAHPDITFDFNLEVKPSAEHRDDTEYSGSQSFSASHDNVQFSFDYTYGPRGTLPDDSWSSSSSS